MSERIEGYGGCVSFGGRECRGEFGLDSDTARQMMVDAPTNNKCRAVWSVSRLPSRLVCWSRLAWRSRFGTG